MAKQKWHNKVKISIIWQYDEMKNILTWQKRNDSTKLKICYKNVTWQNENTIIWQDKNDVAKWKLPDKMIISWQHDTFILIWKMRPALLQTEKKKTERNEIWHPKKKVIWKTHWNCTKKKQETGAFSNPRFLRRSACPLAPAQQDWWRCDEETRSLPIHTLPGGIRDHNNSVNRGKCEKKG